LIKTLPHLPEWDVVKLNILSAFSVQRR